MKKQYLLSIIFISSFILSNAQTIEDIKKLGLTDAQLRTSFEKRQIVLTNNSKRTKKIKEGAFATIKMKDDTTKMQVVLEAFLSDTIIVSSLTPQLAGKEIKLGFTEFKLLPLNDIESIEYSVRHRGVTYWTAFVAIIVGAEFVILPIIMPAITGETELYSQPQFPITVISGVIIFVLGRKVMKSLTLKEYALGTDWSYRVVKK
ncbi:MAG: hypothetical protein DI539_17515 [Flavobacterium psychrophilum]|nr:MAG: hypothetical protein DI539_17515 [Flavobacterium psychrophilum]